MENALYKNRRAIEQHAYREKIAATGYLKNLGHLLMILFIIKCRSE